MYIPSRISLRSLSADLTCRISTTFLLLHLDPQAPTNLSSDLCLDCHLLGEVSLNHRPTHATNVITSHLPLPNTPVFFTGADLQPTPILLTLIDSLFVYIDSTFSPRHTGFLEPSKLSGAFSHLGIPSNKNPFRAQNDVLAQIYSRTGTEYHLTAESVDEICARATEWASDGLDTTPRAPSLTRRGWKRWFVKNSWADPDLLHFVLSNALATGKLVSRRKGEVFRLGCPRESFPRLPLAGGSSRGREAEGSGRRESEGSGRRRARSKSRTGSRPSSRGA